MAKIRITNRAVQALGPDETAYDTEVSGFAIRRQKGGAARYLLRYRIGNRQRWFAIGRHGSPWTADMARKRAIELLQQVALGVDPQATKQDVRSAVTVAEFADRYDRDWITPHKKPSSASSDRYNLKNHIRPLLGRVPMAELKITDVQSFQKRLADRPILANRCVALLSHMCTMAETWGERPPSSNPCLRVKRFRENKRERYLSHEEMSRLGKALADADGVTASTYVVNAIRVLAFTGARLGEVLGLKWDDVDLERRMLFLPDSKTGQKVILLPNTAVAILQTLPRESDNPHVFCGQRRGAPLINIQKPWRAIRAAADLDDVHLHDLRHSFASVAAAQGASLPMIGALLGHRQAQTTARYAHLAESPIRGVLNTAAAEIAEHLAPGSSS